MSWFEERFTPDPRRLKLECSECSHPMWFPKSKFGKYVTCGGACADTRYSKMTKARDAAAARAAAPPPRIWACAHCNVSMIGGRHDRKFCSAPCKGASIRASTTLLGVSRTRQCLRCGKSFVAKKSQLDAGHAMYCSHRCHYDHRPSPLLDAEVKQRAIEKRRASIAVNGTAHKSGAEHFAWKGGHEARVERNRDSTRAYLQKRRRENPERFREYHRVRKAKTVGSSLPRGTVKGIGNAQRWKCIVCRKDIRNAYHVDHITPIALGGAHEKLNIQLLCPSCNVRKSAKDPIDFMQSRGFLL